MSCSSQTWSLSTTAARTARTRREDPATRPARRAFLSLSPAILFLNVEEPASAKLSGCASGLLRRAWKSEGAKMAGAGTSLLGGARRRDERGSRGLISPQTGVVLLMAAFGCAMMAEVVLNGGVLAGHRGELVSASRRRQQQRPFHQLEATGSVHKGTDIGANIDAAIRGVPLVGETVADGLHRVTGGKVRHDWAERGLDCVDMYTCSHLISLSRCWSRHHTHLGLSCCACCFAPLPPAKRRYRLGALSLNAGSPEHNQRTPVASQKMLWPDRYVASCNCCRFWADSQDAVHC